MNNATGLMWAYYSKDQLEDIKLVFRYANLRASDLEPSELSQCMMKPLYSEMLDPTPSSFKFCLLSVYARDKLNSDLGLIFEEDNVDQFPFRALGCLKFLVDGIDGFSDGEEIQKECLSILHRLVSIPNPPVREIVDSEDAVLHMLTLLEGRDDGTFSPQKLAQVLSKLLVEGSSNDYGSGDSEN